MPLDERRSPLESAERCEMCAIVATCGSERFEKVPTTASLLGADEALVCEQAITAALDELFA